MEEDAGYIDSGSTLSEMDDYYSIRMRQRKPYVEVNKGTKFSHIFYDTPYGMVSFKAQEFIIEQIKSLALADAWPPKSGPAHPDTLIGASTGDIFRVPNGSVKSVSAIINDAFLHCED